MLGVHKCEVAICRNYGRETQKEMRSSRRVFVTLSDSTLTDSESEQLCMHGDDACHDSPVQSNSGLSGSVCRMICIEVFIISARCVIHCLPTGFKYLAEQDEQSTACHVQALGFT